MTNDMSITLSALPAKSSGKEARRAAESQHTAPPRGVAPISGKAPVEEAARSEKSSSALASVPKEELAKEQLVGAVSQIQDFAQMLSRELQFDVDEDLGRTVVRVLDKESGDLIRQIPSDEILVLARLMKELREANLDSVDGNSFREQPVGFLMKTQA
ncbi:MAG: flagellar protein FlaG [Pseudomonadota bacterium]